LALDYPVHEILFLDDGSSDTLAFEVAKSFAVDHRGNPNVPQFKIIRFKENRGKREVLIDGFKRASGDYVFLLDSDSEILPNALTELLRPFEDGKTTSCVGNIGILNKNKNFLTKLQSISYFSAFQLGRAAQSVTGNVAICSGAFSVHKKDFILRNLYKFKRTSLFGIHVSAGDDRELTAFSKMSGGKTRYQSTAYCETEAPDNWRKFQSQRRRWQRSAYIGSLASIKGTFPKNIWFMFWAFAEAYFWLIALVIFALSIMAHGFYMDIVDVVLYFIIITYKQNGFYLLYNPVRFLFAPVYFLAYGLSLTYTRIHAALTITNDGWGTRGSVKTEDLEEQGEETLTPVSGAGYEGGKAVSAAEVPACEQWNNMISDLRAAAILQYLQENGPLGYGQLEQKAAEVTDRYRAEYKDWFSCYNTQSPKPPKLTVHMQLVQNVTPPVKSVDASGT